MSCRRTHNGPAQYLGTGTDSVAETVHPFCTSLSQQGEFEVVKVPANLRARECETDVSAVLD